jgi:osmoprotectant transport system ATP-binding protein
LWPVDLEIAAHKTTVLIGPSGSGKSTILRLISGLIEPTSGWIEIDGRKLDRTTLGDLRRRLGYVIQSGDLFPHLSARRNVLLVANESNLSTSETQARLAELCSLVRLPCDRLDRYPVELSGGEQRRVSLIRALMLKPDILLMDEPMGALDPMVRAGLLVDLKAMFERLNTTVILVTHNLAEASRLGDWIVLLNQGRIVQQAALAEFSLCPAEPFVTDFFRAQTEEMHA